MNGPMWIGWAVVVLLAVISVVLLMGKGSFLIAGYNTASKEKKEKYNEKRLCHIAGGGFSLLTVLLAVFTYFKGDLPEYLKWIMPWGYFAVLAVIIILANTICRKK